ncbi:MAG TPA: cobalt-precorrin-6A reductase [Acidobacteriaceae bacterium]|nr:cobalt-precorrin-6A reductase [Acidobacteriaceae bacterium]
MDSESGTASKLHPGRSRTAAGPTRILLLGGTGEAVEIATVLAAVSDVVVISSMAGRVSQPRLPVGGVRVGGFGGVAGLTSYLVEEHIGVVIDATHPFASRMSRNAELACQDAGVPLIPMERPPWKPGERDRWLTVPDFEAASALVNNHASRVFLSIGRQELGAFSGCYKAWFLVRAIERPDELPPNSKLLLDRGPFHLEDELQMLRQESINLLVSKNSGGQATYPKIQAASELGIPVVMVDRPAKHTVPTVASPADVLLKLAELL